MKFQYDIQTEAIISAGLQLLRKHLGTVEAEIFLLNVNRKGFDYTKWREKLYEDMTLTELLDHAADVTKNYVPPKGIEII